MYIKYKIKIFLGAIVKLYIRFIILYKIYIQIIKLLDIILNKKSQTIVQLF